MYENQKLEIPEPMREIAERNVEQARGAYNQFMDMARQAQDLAAKSQGAMAQSALDIRSKAMTYTEQNIASSFDFAARLAKAKDLKEYFEIQQQYAQRQMQTYAQQAQELGRLMTEVAQKAQPKL